MYHFLLSSQGPNQPMSKQTQDWTGKLSLYRGQRLHSYQPLDEAPGLCLAHLLTHHLATVALPWAKAQDACPSATLALGNLSPTLALAIYPSSRRADQQWPQGQ